MNYTSKIVTINKTDSFKTGDGKTMNKYVVTFANGHNPHIYALGEFKYEVGTEVTYDLDQNKNKAKIVKNDFPRGNGVPYQSKGNYTNKDQNLCLVEDDLILKCGEGYLAIRLLQVEGKVPVKAKEFVNGYKTSCFLNDQKN